LSFDVESWIMSPFILMFISVVVGVLFGRIKFGYLSFGGSGALFSGLVLGWWVWRYAGKFQVGDAAYAAAQALIRDGVVDVMFFNLFLILFVVPVGLLAAKDIGRVIKKYGGKFLVLSVLITFIGAAGSYVMAIFSNDVSPFEVTGVYTGALTSSPGLAAALESAREEASERAEKYEASSEQEKARFLRILGMKELTPENTGALSAEKKALFIRNAEAGVGVGHTIGYPFGVIIVILAMNFFPRLFKIDVEKEKKLFLQEMGSGHEQENAQSKQVREVDFDLVGFVFVCLFGYSLGQINVFLGPLGNIGLGATGGALLGALLLGYIGDIGFVHFRMSNKILGVIRDLALVFFLSTVGLRYGFKVFDALLGAGAYLAFVSVAVGFAALLAGFVVGRYVLGINWVILSGAICGGMTSTPGLGCCIDALKSDVTAAGYGATYPFALLSMVIFSIILHKMPV